MRWNKTALIAALCFIGVLCFLTSLTPVYASSAFAQETGDVFDFGAVDNTQLQSAEKPSPPGHPIFYILPGVLFLVAFLLIFILWIRAKDVPGWPRISLGGLPVSFKLMITLFLSVYGLVHVVALINVFVQTKIVYQSAAEYFFYMPIQKLTGTTHAHLFGHSTMYALTALAFMFTSTSEKIKIPVVAAAFFGAPFDLYSWWLIKYLGGEYEILSAISGASISLAFLTMYGFVNYELWAKRGSVNGRGYKE